MSHFQAIQASVHTFHTFGRQTCTVPSQDISHHKPVLYPNAFRNAALAAFLNARKY